MKIPALYPEGYVQIEAHDTRRDLLVVEVNMHFGSDYVDKRYYTRSTLHDANLHEFVEEFDAFILDRSGSPSLAESSHDSCLEFSGSGDDLARGSAPVMLEYRFSDVTRGCRFLHTGTLEVNQEYLVQILEGFRRLESG